MSKTQVKVDRSEAKEKITGQIDKGKELVESGMKILGETPRGTGVRTRARDNFKVLYDQWVQFTIEMLDQVFVSSSYSREFERKVSSRREYVSSDWVPDVKYYLERALVPKIDYLSILGEGIDQFQKAKGGRDRQISVRYRGPDLDVPERVTLAWLWRHVPVKFWFWLVTLLIVVLVIGITLGQMDWVREFIRYWRLLTSR